MEGRQAVSNDNKNAGAPGGVKMARVEGHSEERFLGSDVFESNNRNLPPPNGTGTVPGR